MVTKVKPFGRPLIKSSLDAYNGIKLFWMCEDEKEMFYAVTTLPNQCFPVITVYASYSLLKFFYLASHRCTPKNIFKKKKEKKKDYPMRGYSGTPISKPIK